MLLSELVAAVHAVAPGVELELSNHDDPTIGAISLDSREVGPGAMFACTRGVSYDGHDFAADAVSAGAVVLLVDHRLGLGVPEIVVADTREALGWFAAAFQRMPSRSMAVVGITGTNGKTTSAHLLTEVLRHAGRHTATIGTLSGAHTTPEAPELQARFAAERDAGANAVVVEVSSHALAQHRVDGTWFEVTAFTNLTLDHLDFHGSFEEYFEAKASLFRPDRTRLAIIDVGSPMGRRMADVAAAEVLEVSLDDTTDLELSPTSSAFNYSGHRFMVPLAGRFNVSNALVVIRCAEAMGLPLDAVADGLANAGPVPGRVERVDVGQEFTVIVDYAHTPDGLANVLMTARELATGRVLVVFGCGGDRDRSKRPEMGSVAADLADVVVVTSDNPRSEEPMGIIGEILSGVPGDAARPHVDADRRAAMAHAFATAEPGDIVVVAGKGHETTQTIGDRVEDFDDRRVARELLSRSNADAPASRENST